MKTGVMVRGCEVQLQCNELKKATVEQHFATCFLSQNARFLHLDLMPSRVATTSGTFSGSSTRQHDKAAPAVSCSLAISTAASVSRMRWWVGTTGDSGIAPKRGGPRDAPLDQG